jgi:hypothetical protein
MVRLNNNLPDIRNTKEDFSFLFSQSVLVSHLLYLWLIWTPVTCYIYLCYITCSSDVVLSMLGHIYQSWWFLVVFWNDYFIITCNVVNSFLFRGQDIHLASMTIHIFLQASLHWWCNLILQAHKNHTHKKGGRRILCMQTREHFMGLTMGLLWLDKCLLSTGHLDQCCSN